MFVRLADEVVAKLATGKKVKYAAVENFLLSLPREAELVDVLGNLEREARLYNWTPETMKAIYAGLKLSLVE